MGYQGYIPVLGLRFLTGVELFFDDIDKVLFRLLGVRGEGGLLGLLVVSLAGVTGVAGEPTLFILQTKHKIKQKNSLNIELVHTHVIIIFNIKTCMGVVIPVCVYVYIYICVLMRIQGFHVCLSLLKLC